MRRALDEYFVEGIKTNLEVFRRILRFPDFLEGKLDTGLLDRLFANSEQSGAPVTSESADDLASDRLRAAAVAAALYATTRGGNSQPAGNHLDKSASNWKIAGRRALLRPNPPGQR
jgi:acetyl-CoA carboxylase biotin carboxylase subunit